jgi:integrating conjugative element protein (TIGR03757 family)
MNYSKKVAVIIACLLMCAGVRAQTSTYTRFTAVNKATPSNLKVEVFTNSAIALSGLGTVPATVYQLDGLLQLEAELSQGLPGDEAQATVIARERLRKMSGRLQERAINTSTGLTLVARYKLDRLPAVVINGQSVIYGVPDLNKAIELYRQAKGG